MPKITTFLAYDDQAEAAARCYVEIFPNSTIKTLTRYGKAGPGAEGTVMTVVFELDGQEFVALNGGPHFKLTDGISLSVECDSQAEIDRYWDKLSQGGEKGPCGWLKDRFGLSWQVNPRRLGQMLADPDAERAQRVMKAMLQMGKIDLAALERAYAGR